MRRPFAFQYAVPAGPVDGTVPYTYDPTLQLNVLADGRPAITDRDLLLAAGTTTSKAGSQTHFDD
ncbi:putative ATP-grasp-modified RiPP [Streptomyces sp. MUM 203J]|uniref:putative ATP-grasp-modified RiPP n=1 Tax=Streptomyces sp. MUM 203J TaxID=2791990 RepID=UPI001F03FB0D|nr:putative ATP-grasp-modified RiPP [Streptomyces sp. MUM 203J]MCH0541461.1 putative ATP-grasp-modified RiPP [Streptomyces sp. MUM 203J]